MKSRFENFMIKTNAFRSKVYGILFIIMDQLKMTTMIQLFIEGYDIETNDQNYNDN